MELFYFSRTGAPNPLTRDFVVSGVIEAESLEAAKAALDESLRAGKRTDRHDSFKFANLRETERAPSGMVVVTMVGA